MAKDPKEYGYEGEMVMSQLKGIIMHAKQLHDKLKPDTDLPEWVQSKITLAYDYIQTASDYMSTEMNEEAIKWVKNKSGSGYTSHDGKREIVKHPKGWISRSTTDRYDYSDVFPTQREAKAGKYAWAMKEDAPVNAVGGGNIAGIGVGPKGEPGIKPKAMSKYKRKNAQQAPKAGRKTFTQFLQGR